MLYGEKAYQLNVIARKWNTLRYAWKYGGTPAVIKLFKELKYRPQIRRMLKEHTQRDQIYDQWFRQSLPGQEERELQHGRVFHHTLSYLIPTYNTRPDLLRALADSFLAQTCDAWEVCMYDGASTNEATLSMLKQLSEEDSRFHVVFGKENLGISGNTNKALVLASSDYVALCDHDDLITPDCTYWILDAAERGADFIYSDEDKTNEDESLFFDPHMKPDFSPDALRSGNYICHIMAMSTELMRSLSGLRSCCDGSQDHDLALRATEKAVAIAHIPRVLYHWRMVNTSFSHSSSERCANAAVRAVQDQLDRLHLNGSAENHMLQTYVSYNIPDDATVSLIIHSLDGGFDKAWALRLLKYTNEEARRRVCELLIVGASGQLPDLMGIPVHAVLSIDEAGQNAQGNLLTFLEQGTKPREPFWLERLMMYATRPWIATAGGSIVDRKQNYILSGYAVHVPGCAMGMYQGDNSYGPTYQLLDRKVREVSGISFVCAVMRKALFLQLGGFDPYKSDLGAVALGLKGMQYGLSSVIVPEAICTASDHSVLYGDFAPHDILQFQKDFMNPVEHYYPQSFERENGSMQIDASVHRDTVTVITMFDNHAAEQS